MPASNSRNVFARSSEGWAGRCSRPAGPRRRRRHGRSHRHQARRHLRDRAPEEPGRTHRSDAHAAQTHAHGTRKRRCAPRPQGSRSRDRAKSSTRIGDAYRLAHKRYPRGPALVKRRSLTARGPAAWLRTPLG